jgi:hypothetical protein
VTPEAFFATATGVSFFVKDYDAVGKNDLLGRVVVGQEELLHGKGERKLYALEDTPQPDHPVSATVDEIMTKLRYSMKLTTRDREDLFYAFGRPQVRTLSLWSVSRLLKNPASWACTEMKR